MTPNMNIVGLVVDILNALERSYCGPEEHRREVIGTLAQSVGEYAVQIGKAADHHLEVLDLPFHSN